MLCRCGHPLDHTAADGTRKIRTPMALIKPATGGGDQLFIVCPQCREEVPVQVGGEQRLARNRVPVLYLQSPPLTPERSTP